MRRTRCNYLAWVAAVVAGLGAAANEVTVSPSVSGGDYTVSWPSIAGAEEYSLHETKGGETTTYDRVTTTASYSFSGKAAGTYSYEVDFCQFGVCADTGYTAGTVRVNSKPTVAAIGDVRVGNGRTRRANVRITDGDRRDRHTVSATSDTTSVVTVAVSGRQLSLTALERGTAKITYSATDNSGASNATSDALTFDATVPNSRPVVAALSAQSLAGGGSTELTVAVTDADANDTHTVAARSNKTGVSTVAVDGKELTVSAVGRGEATVTYWATDNSEETTARSKSGTFSVTVANSRPSVTAVADQSVAVSTSASIDLAVEDGDAGDTHTASASTSDATIAEVSVSGTTLTLTGVAAGSATITYSVQDNSDATNEDSDEGQFTVLVVESNRRPVVGQLAEMALSIGAPRTATVVVTDGDTGDTHTVSASSSDEDVATVAVSEKTLTVTGLAVGTATITYSASDDSGASNDESTAKEFVVRVSNARPTVGVLADLQVGIGKDKTATVQVADNDPEDTHTVAAASSRARVATVSVSGKALTITGKAAGTAKITYSATDSSGAANAKSAERSFNVTVANSRPTVAAIADRSVAEDGTTQATVSVSDDDAEDTHTIAASSNRTRTARVTVDGTTLTIRGLRAGRATISVTADDGTGAANAVSAAVTFDVTVISGSLVVTVAPEVNAGAYTVSWPAVTAAESYMVHEEHDGRTRSYEETANSKAFTGKAVGLYTYTVDFCQFGVCSPTGYGSSSARVNSRPTVGAVTTQTVAAGDEVEVSVAVADADDGDSPLLRARSADTGTATVSVSGTTLNVAGVNRGATTVSYWATDGTGAENQKSSERTFRVSVPNSRPSIAPVSAANVDKGATATRTVVVSDADPRDTHTVAADSGDEGVATVAVSGKTLTVTGVAAGSATITVTARDNSRAANALSAERTFEVTVASTNARPVVGAIRGRRVGEGNAVSVRVSVSDADAADTHAVTASSSRTAVARVSVSGEVLTVTGVRAGTSTISVTATDSSGADNDTSEAVDFDVMVISGTLVVSVEPAVNDGDYTVRWPAIVAAEAYTVYETHLGRTTPYDRTTTTNSKAFTGKPVGVYSYTVHYCQVGGCWETGYGAGSGRVNSEPTVGTVRAQTVAAGDEVEVSVAVADADDGDSPLLRARSADTDTATVSVSGTTLNVAGVNRGATTVEYWATDGTGAGNQESSVRTFRVTVPNSRPSIAVVSAASVDEGATATRTVVVSDADPRDTHTIVASTSDEEVATVAVSAKRLTVTGVAAGSATITVTARDNSRASNALSAERTFEVTVGGGNTRPVVAGLEDKTVAVGDRAQQTVTVTDPDDADTHTLSVSSSNTAVAVVSATGTTLVIRGVSTGTATITVIATDSSGASNAASEPADFTVRAVSGPLAVAVSPEASSGDYTVSWPAIPGAEAYTLYEEHGGSTTEYGRTTTTNSKAFTGKAAGLYTYTVHFCQFGVCADTQYAPGSVRVNSRPVVAAVAAQTVDRGRTATVDVSVSDADADNPVSDLTVSATSADPGVATVTVAGHRLTLAGVAYGRTTVAVTARDRSGAPNAVSEELRFAVSVGGGVVSVSPQASAGSHTVSWPAYRGATSYRLTEARGDETETHDVVGTARAFAGKTAGRYAYTVESCTAGACTATGYDAGTTRVNSRPVIDPIANRSVAAGGSVGVRVTVSDADADDPPASLTVAATSADTAVTTVDVEGRTVTVRGVAAGNTTVTVTASDASMAPNQVSEPATFRVTVSGRAVAVSPSPSGGNHVVSWPAYHGASFYRLYEAQGESSVSHDVEGTSKAFADKAPGSYEYTVDGCTAVDVCTSTGYASATVRVNAQPVVAAIAGQSVRVDASVDAVVVVTDADGEDIHEVVAESSDASVATVSVAGNTLTITGAASGTATVTYSATDNSAAPNARSAEATFLVEVSTGNRRPVVAEIGALRVLVGETATVAVSVSDADQDDTHSVAAASSNPSAATVSVEGEALSIVGAARGTATITVTATDSSGADNAVSAPVRATVTVVQPSGAIAVVPAVSGGDYVVSWPEVAAAATYTLREQKGDAAEVYANISGTTRSFTGKDPGTYTYSVDSCRTGGTCTATGFDAASVRVNSPPVIAEVPPQSVAVGREVTVPVAVTDSDDPAESLSVEAESTDASAATVAAAGTTLTVSGVAAGTATIRYRADDGSGATNAKSSWHSFEVTVTTSNEQPTVAALTDRTLGVGASAALTVVVADADANDEHTVGARSSDTGIVTTSVSGTTLTLQAVAAGSATVTYWATDDSEAPNAKSEEREFRVVVAAVQCAGTASGAITGPTTSADGSFTLAWTGDHCLAMHDADGFWHFANPSGANSSKSFAGLPSGQYRFKLYSCALRQTEGGATWGCSYSTRAHTVNVTRDAETALATTYVAGTTAYTAGVGHDGSVRISVPIETIPGVHGLSLPIMLDYSSTRHTDIADIHVIDDHIGHGWRLAGIPRLHRCRVGIGGALALDSTDRLCLNGIALVAVSGTYWAPGAEYRTEIQTHLKLLQRGTASEPWFEAYWPDGRTGTFGKTGSRVRASQRRTADTCNDGPGTGLWCFEETPYLKWGLDAMTHPFGNTLAVSYETHEPHGVLNPKTITYDNAEVRFRYGPRGDLAARAVGSISKVRRHSVLHTIDVGFRGRAVRQYRLDSNTSGGNVRLEKIQQCGYTEAGTLEGCLAPLAFSWTTVAGAPQGFTVGVSGITDGLGADTSFSYRTLGTTHSFGYAERPFGSLVAATDAAGMSQVVAITLNRDDGRHGTRAFEYRYRGAAQRSTKGRGYLGFPATRVRDVAGGSYTYRQLRMDWPFLGAVARTRTLSGTSGSTGAEILSRLDSSYAALSMHRGAVRYPYTSRTTRWNYVEGGALGATKTVVAYTQSGEFLTRRTTTATTGSTVTVGPHTPTVWGDVPDRPIGGVVRTVTTTDDFANTASDWTIGKLTGRTTVYAAPGETTKTVDATFGYRAGSRVVSRETRLPSHPSLTLTTTRTFTAAGHVATEQVAGDGVAARTTSFGAYAEGRYPSSATNPLGHRTGFGYDVRHGAPKRIADPDARVATREYDAFGRVVRSRAADGTEATTTYERCTACPNLSAGEEAMSVTTTLRNGATQVAPTRRVYLDVLGREVVTEVEAFDSADGWRRQFRNYDPQGRLRHVSRPFFSTATAAACWRSADCTVHNYGSADDQAESRIVRPDGGSLETVRSAVEGTATVDATVLIRREGTTAVERRTKRTRFNAAGEIVETVDGHGAEEAVSTTYGYDAQGNLSRVAVAGVEVARMVYDELGNRTAVANQSLDEWTFEHNALSELVRRVDAKGNETRYRYDALGRPRGRDECHPPCSSPATSTWTYDPANATGALASRSGGGLTETWTYRADGRPERVDTRIAVPGVLTESYARTFAYDAAGRPSSVDHDGTVFARTYTARGHLREVRHGATALHEYRGADAFGSSTEERLGGGALTTTRGYDPGTGRLAGIATGRTAAGGTPKGIQDLAYGWRTDGDLHRRTDGRGTAATADDLTDTFTADALGRVVRQETTGAATRRKDYAYDAFGNLTSKTSRTPGDLDVALTPSTNLDGPYRLATATVGGATARFIYDRSGNALYYSQASGHTLVQYDAGNRVKRIDAGGREPRDEFWHGPDGARFLRRETWTESGTRRTRLTVHLGAFEEARPSHGDFAKVRRIRATDAAVRVAKTARAGTDAADWSGFAYLHRDHLGSVDRATDGAGNAFGVGATSFDPFGSHRRADRSADLDAAGREALLAAEDERSPRGFTDHEHLSRTGFVHMNGRVYDPRLGRFLSPDPIVANPFHSQSWNRYSYVRNRPMSSTDPTGNYMSGSYYGLTADHFNAVDINAMMMADLWDYVSWSGSGVRFYQLSTLDSVLTRGLTNDQLDYYLATGRDPRRTALKAAGEFLFPEDGSQDLEGYAGVIATNGVRGDRAELQDLANKTGVPVYFNRSHGLLFDLLQALSQRMSPRTDGLARGLALALREAGWSGKLLAHSQGTLTVVNAVRHFGLGATGAELRSPATSYRSALRAFEEKQLNYVQPWGDAANLWAPSANPFRWASGFYDLLCGFCVHRANGLEAALEAGP